MTLKNLLDLIEDDFYLRAIVKRDDPKYETLKKEGFLFGHVYEPSEILAGNDSLPKDFLDWEITIEPWDFDTLLVTLKQPRRNDE